MSIISRNFLSVLEDSWLNIAIDSKTLYNPLENIPKECEEEPYLYLTWLMSRPDYFSFFCSQILNINLLPFQCLILRELWNRKFPMLIMSRGGSKSYLLALYSILRMSFIPGRKVVICGSAFRQSKIIFSYMENIWKSAPLLRDMVGTTNNGPYHEPDMYTFRIGESITQAIPIGCLSRDTLVTTDCGIRCMGDYSVNCTPNSVWSDMTFQDVGFFFDNGVHDCKMVLTKRGYSYTGTHNHKMRIVRNNQIMWCRTDQMLVGDYIVIDKSKRWFDTLFQCTNDDAYVLGCMIGDGSYVRKDRLQFTTIDSEFIDILNRVIGEFRQQKDGTHYFMCNSKLVSKWMDFWGINFAYAKNKYLPNSILSASKEAVANCIAGLIDTDGHIFVSDAKSSKSVSIHYTTISEKLAKQIQFILLHFGIISTIAYRDRNSPRSGLPAQRVYEIGIYGEDVQIFKNCIPLRLQRKKQQLENGLNSKSRVVSINSNIIPIDKNLLLDILESNVVGNRFGRKDILQRKNITSSYLKRFLEKCIEKKIKHRNLQIIRDLLNDNLYYDEISSITDINSIHTVDLNVPHNNTYCANGFVSHNTGEKIRGLRSHDIFADEFAAIPRDIFENVIAGFGAVSANPVEKVKEYAKNKLIKSMGDIVPIKTDDTILHNQIVLSGTAYYEFNHFAEYWKRWKRIIDSKGDPEKLTEVFGDDAIPDDFNWKDYSIIRIPHDLLPQGFMDDGMVARSKATVHSGIFNMEFNSVFTTDSNGFFRRSLIESCVPSSTSPIIINGKEIKFAPMLIGDSNKHYIYGVDPASEIDNFSIVILEEHGNHRRVVYVWTTNKKSHREDLKKGLITDTDFYSYCTTKIRSLMRKFPCARIAIDSQGGGIAVAEALHDLSRCGVGELPLWPVIDPLKEKDTDGESGLHILEMINFSSAEWTSEANHGLKKDFEDKVCLFPAFDSSTFGLAALDDTYKNRTGDSLEDCILEIEELKNELSTIMITQTTLGRDRWDVPEVKLPGGKKGRMRKDRYSALLMANAVARKLIANPPRIIQPSIGGFAVSGKLEKGGLDFVGPSWFTTKMNNIYD